MKEHNYLHNGKKQGFKCPFCPAYIGRKRDLQVHNKKYHYSKQPLLCEKCEMTFPDRFHLKRHKKKHGVKYLQCLICNYSSSTEIRMEKHSLKHKSSKPFQCDLCDNLFRTKDLLIRHQNLRHHPTFKSRPKFYKCSHCDKRFINEKNFENNEVEEVWQVPRMPGWGL